MGGGAAKYPEPTPEERQLQQRQSDLLTLQSGQLQRGVSEQQALSPYLYRQMGLTPQYDLSGNVTGFQTDPQFDRIMALNRDYQLGLAEFAPEQLAAQRGLLPEQTAAAESGLNLQTQQNLFNQRQQERQEAMLPQLYQEMGLREIRDAEGNVTGFERLADPTSERGREIQRLQEERSLAALRGELPTDPALLRDLQQREALKREELRRQLGTGYGTGTAGSEALGRFEEARAMTLDEARRKDLTMAESLALNRQQGNLTQDQYRTQLMQGIKPTSFLQSASSPFGGAGGGNAFAGLSGLSGLPGATTSLSGNFGDVFSGFNQVQGNLANWRGNQFQGRVAEQQQQQANNQLYGSMAATSAMVAAVAASSRTLKADIAPMRPEDESRTLAELMGEY